MKFLNKNSSALNLFYIFGLLICSSFILGSCGESAGPPEKVIKQAKEFSYSVMDSVKQVEETVKASPELVDEFYEPDKKRYVLEYHLETSFGSPVTDSPKVFIVKQGQEWFYKFEFDKVYNFPISK